MFSPLFWKPVAFTAGSRVREDWDGSSGGTATKDTPVARISNLFSLSSIQLIVVPDEFVLGEARHLFSHEHLRSCVARTIRRDIHQTGVAVRDHIVTPVTTTNLTVDASYLVRFARRECSEGLELVTGGGE